MKTRKILSALLALALILGLAPTALAEAPDLSRKITLTYYHNGAGQGRFPDDQDEILKILNEKFNMDLQLNIIESEYESKLNLQVASGNTPDIMQVSASQFESFYEQDLLLPIEDYIDRMPNFLATYPGIQDDPTLRVDGHLYFLEGNKPADQIVKSYSSLWIRKDWLDKLGLEAPTTLDEFQAVAVAFATQDPDGNGVNDTFGYSGMGGVATQYCALNPILGAFGTGNQDWLIEDGALVYSATQPAYREALAWLRDFIATGAVDPDIMLMNTFDQVREKVYRNQVGMIYFSWAEFIKPPYDEMLKEMTPDAQWIQIAPPQGPAGAYDWVYDIPGAKNKGRVLSADLAKDPVKLERVLSYLDYIVAGEGADLVCYGIEGVHYNKVDGKIVTTDRVGEVSYLWQHQVMSRNEPVYLATKFPGCSEEIAFAAGLARLDGYNNFVATPTGLNSADLKRYVEEETVRFLYGKRDLKTFDDFVKTLYDVYGLAQYVEGGTQALKAAGLL